MARWKSARGRTGTARPGTGRPGRPGFEFLKAQITLAALVVAAAAPFLILIALVPRPIVLPTLCALALAGAALAAAFAWFSSARRQSECVTPWDVAGALALIGFVAGAVSEPDQVLLLFERQSLTQ